VSAVPAARYSGPSALGDDFRRFWNLTWTLATTDWKLRFYGSLLGYVWTLARPFMLFGVIYVVFAEFADLGARVPHYAVYVLFAMVLFQFFAEITGGSVAALVSRENLLRKVRFPRLVIPMAVALTALFNLGMTLIAVVIFAVLSGVYPGFGWLQLPLLVAVLLVLAVGVGMMLSALFVRYRDIQPIWEVFSQMLFYGSPVLYVTTMVPDKFQHAYGASPIAAVLAQLRHAVIDPGAPSAAEAIGGAGRLIIPAAIVVAVCAWMVDLQPRGPSHRREPVSAPTDSPLSTAERAELEFLRRRVLELDQELAETERRAAQAIAAAQKRAYWLDRWHVDLNALMARPVAGRARSAARAGRRPIRALRLLTRRLRSR
jgi:ABC-2 type transport system permease protein